MSGGGAQARRRPVTSPTRRIALIGAGATFWGSSAARAVTPIPFGLTGAFRQGGWMMVRGDPGADVRVDGQALTQTGPDGVAILGFDRDAATSVDLAVVVRGAPHRATLALDPVAYDVQHIDGLPHRSGRAQRSGAPRPHRGTELKRKQAALASRDPAENFRDGFVLPLDNAVRTSAFGPQRVLNGVPKTPHYGVDLAAPAGTPIHAPADGLVVFADPHMHFEGGLTLIDHGQGLISMYLHQSRQDVTEGMRVRRGQAIGAVGMTGRATGPHLCWRMTWRGRHMGPVAAGGRPRTRLNRPCTKATTATV